MKNKFWGDRSATESRVIPARFLPKNLGAIEGMGVESKYIKYGETLDSEKKLKKELDAFFKYIRDTSGNPYELLLPFAKVRSWSRGKPKAIDLRALWHYYERENISPHFTKPPFIKEWWGSPEGRREIIALKYEKNVQGQPISNEQLKEINNRIRIRENALNDLANVKNDIELQKNGPRIFSCRHIKPC